MVGRAPADLGALDRDGPERQGRERRSWRGCGRSSRPRPPTNSWWRHGSGIDVSSSGVSTWLWWLAAKMTGRPRRPVRSGGRARAARVGPAPATAGADEALDAGRPGPRGPASGGPSRCRSRRRTGACRAERLDAARAPVAAPRTGTAGRRHGAGPRRARRRRPSRRSRHVRHEERRVVQVGDRRRGGPTTSLGHLERVLQRRRRPEAEAAHRPGLAADDDHPAERAPGAWQPQYHM